jgi:outer membrane protein assembly factor BamA
MQPTLLRSAFAPIVILLLCHSGLQAAAPNIAEVVFDGLPEDVAAESLSNTLRQKVGTIYDKPQLPADRERVVTRLKDLGYLDADARATVSFIPAGIRVTYAIKPRNRYSVEAVKVDGVAEAELATIVAAAKIDQQTACTQDVIDRLLPAIAPKFGINVLYIETEWKQNADKKQAVLVLRR